MEIQNDDTIIVTNSYYKTETGNTGKAYIVPNDVKPEMPFYFIKDDDPRFWHGPYLRDQIRKVGSHE